MEAKYTAIPGLTLTENRAFKFQDWLRKHDEEIRKAGIREVVEWIEKEFGYFTDEGLAKIIIDDFGYYGKAGSIKKWQAFKKKKGITEEAKCQKPAG